MAFNPFSGTAGQNGPGGAMSWMQDTSAQPALGHALMGGTQVMNTGSDWTAGSPMPPGRFTPSPEFQNSPQPVPGMPPQQMQPPDDGGIHAGTPGLDAPLPQPITWAPDWQQRMLPPGTQPGLTRGSGQPINQPMVPGSGPSGTWTPQDAARFTQKSGPMPASGGGFISQPMGSLQSLGGGQLNQSGMGRRAPIYQLGNRAMPSKQQAMLKALIAQMMGR